MGSLTRKGIKKLTQAKQLIRAVGTALRNGVPHYDKHGRLLTTEREVLEALRDDGFVTFGSPDGARLGTQAPDEPTFRSRT